MHPTQEEITGHEDRPDAASQRKGGGDGIEILNVEHLKYIFAFLLLGLAVATTVFVCELAFVKRVT